MCCLYFFLDQKHEKASSSLVCICAKTANWTELDLTVKIIALVFTFKVLIFVSQFLCSKLKEGQSGK